MEYTADELAGIVDLFGALEREVLERAVGELAFRAGDEMPEREIQSSIDAAIDAYALVAVELDGESLLAPGPTAFPELPAGADDLPHILDVDRREVPQDATEAAVRKRLAGAAATLEDPSRAATLIDITYDTEAWAGVDLADVRDRLEAIVDESG